MPSRSLLLLSRSQTRVVFVVVVISTTVLYLIHIANSETLSLSLYCTLSPPGTIMHTLFPFNKMLSNFFCVSFPVSASRSYSIASSSTQFTYTSKPFNVPVNSLCPLFMMIQTFSLTHLSTSSDGKSKEGLFVEDVEVGRAISCCCYCFACVCVLSAMRASVYIAFRHLYFSL